MILKKNRTWLLSNINQILKKFWKYVNSKSKHTEKIGDIKLNDEQGKIVICSLAESKADALCKFFSTVFCNEIDKNYEPLWDRICLKDCSPISVTEEDVLERLSKLNINKSEGPDLLHPRVIYEIRHQIAYPLAKLFNKSLEIGKIPEIWKCANVCPIYKRVKRRMSVITDR